MRRSKPFIDDDPATRPDVEPLVLSWFPPAPTPGPKSIVDLPPDDWSMECKVDGIRVLVLPGGDVWTRHGSRITKYKGMHLVRKATDSLDTKIDAEWEFRGGIMVLHIFDLPDHPGTYDERVAEIPALIAAIGPLSSDGVSVQPIMRATGPFRDHYEAWKSAGHEGVVVKRRASLYSRMPREKMETRDWVKYRFSWGR